MLASLLASRKRLLGLGPLVYEIVEKATVERLQTACQQLTSLQNFRGIPAVQGSTASTPEGLLASRHAKPICHELSLQHAARLLHSQSPPLQQSRVLLVCPSRAANSQILHRQCHGANM